MAGNAHLVLFVSLLALGSVALQAQDGPEPDEPTSTASTEVTLDEIEVVASHSILREEPVSAVALSREQIEQLPHFGDDLYRAIAVLPGTSSGDFSAALCLMAVICAGLLAALRRLQRLK